MTGRIACFITLIVLLCGGAGAASFDCGKAKSTSEKLICQDQELSFFDDELFKLYKLAKSQAADLGAFKQQSQANWKLREQCQDQACLKNWYQSTAATYKTVLAKSCLDYNKPAELSGQLQRITFPSPDGEASVGFYLKLAQPVCATGKFGEIDSVDVPMQGVKLIQLVLDSHGYAALRPYLKHTVRLHGDLFCEHTAYHHAPLLLGNVTLDAQ